MKKLITTDLGGHPIYFKDLEFIQEQLRELALATFGHLNSSAINILNGCAASVSSDGYTVNISEGYAYYNGEFFHVPQHQAIGSTPNVAKWRIIESWDSRGFKTFKSESVGVKAVYKLRELQVAFYPSASEGILFSDTLYADRGSTWTELSVQSPYVVDVPLKYRKDTTGKLEIVGSFHHSTPYPVVGILPSAFRPNYYASSIITVTAVFNNVTQNMAGIIWINPTGEIIVNCPYPFAGTITFYINNVIPLNFG